jgi:mannose/cellobiose epimerase-like protein (N-acyl-D-glucosamine 2-epimerase family)
MPDILISAMGAGFNDRHGGMYKAVNNRTGEIIDSEMPWWNLPETMRGALFAALAAKDPEKRSACLDAFAKCHNAYFTHYLNPDLMLFPFQTRSGESGAVMDTPPSVPEGDPLYHSNLCFLDMLPYLNPENSPVP